MAIMSSGHDLKWLHQRHNNLSQDFGYPAPFSWSRNIKRKYRSNEQVLINNNGYADTYELLIDEIPDDSVDLPFSFQFENNTDSIIRKKITLHAWSSFRTCFSTDTTYLRIYPANDTLSEWNWQNPLPYGDSLKSVFFTDVSTGYTTATSEPY